MKKMEMYIISHTHFDREWRRHFEQYRMQLVDLLDHLFLIMDSDRGYRHFTLDGQVSLIGDYLTIRPEMEKKFKKYASSGRIQIGPWYSLIDENLVWGESIIRNLLYGHRIASEYGKPMKVGYGISSFGHISQIPQIFRGFEIDNFIFSRGISEWQTKSEFIWEAPDGSQVLAFHLPDNYTKSNWFYVVYREGIGQVAPTMWRYKWSDPLGSPFHTADLNSIDNNYRMLQPLLKYNADDIFNRVMQLEKECEEKATTPYLLAMDGVDHIEPNPLIPEIIKEVNKRLGYEFLIHSTLEDYIAKVRKDVKDLEVIKGEMRRTTREGIHNLLFGYGMSARMYLKQANQKVQTEVIRWAEPLCTVNHLLGFDYPKSQFDRIWRYIMDNHAHDSISGCSIDSVHELNMHRFNQAQIIASELSQRAFWRFIPLINNSSLQEDEMAITIFNSPPYKREEEIIFAIDIPEEMKSVRLLIKDLKGNEVPYQLMNIDKALAEMLQPMNAQVSTMMDRYFIAISAKIPPMGYTTYIVKPLRKQPIPKRYLGSLSPKPNVMENEFLRVEIEGDGRINIFDKVNNHSVKGLHYFEDRGEAGDAWMTTPPVQDEIYTTIGNSAIISKVADGPMMCTYRIEHTLLLPKDIFPPKVKVVTEEGLPLTRGRHFNKVEVKIISEITLKKSSKRLEIKTTIDNQAKSHRLRVCFPSGLKGAKYSSAEVPFDVIDRDIQLPNTSDWREMAYTEHPQLGFVSVSDGNYGLSIINEGITEYAVIDDEDKTIALTLLRAVGRSTGEDWDPKGSQCLGINECRYSIYPHKGNWESAKTSEQILLHNTPIKATQSCKYDGILPQESSFLKIDNPNIVIDAFKKAEDKNSIILRFHNPTNKKQNVTISSDFFKLKNAYYVNFLEERKGKIPISQKNKIKLSIDKKKIVTIELMMRLKFKIPKSKEKWDWFILKQN